MEGSKRRGKKNGCEERRQMGEENIWKMKIRQEGKEVENEREEGRKEGIRRIIEGNCHRETERGKEEIRERGIRERRDFVNVKYDKNWEI